MMSGFSFEVLAQDAGTAARRGEFRTPHGNVSTPAFMPVGTQGSVKGVTPAQLAATRAQMILGNTYHLALRPGAEVVRNLGGLHGFMDWDGPILTDSGGFQIFSLRDRMSLTEEAATFRSHIDGSLVTISPEEAVRLQEALGSDVAMVLDHVVQLPNTQEKIREAMERSIRWARRCQHAATRDDQALFAIVQGGLDRDLRQFCAAELVALDFPGYAIGGLSVGEPPEAMYEVLDYTVPELPEAAPRYLMGVGRPLDLLEGIRRGVDLFDCVMPTRNGRNGMAFTTRGPVRVRNAKHREETRPLDETCPCEACRHSLGYLRHLFQAEEMLGPTLLSIHNLTYYQRLLAETRAAIEAGQLTAFIEQIVAGWEAGNDDRQQDSLQE